MKLDGRVALVTGAGRRVGRAIALGAGGEADARRRALQLVVRRRPTRPCVSRAPRARRMRGRIQADLRDAARDHDARSTASPHAAARSTCS